MILLRFFVGTVALPKVVLQIAHGRGVEGATAYAATGLWRGETEPCTVLELVTEARNERDLAPGLAEALRAAFDQDAVLWTASEVRATLATRPPQEVAPHA